MSNDLHWTTAISKIQANEVRLRGYRIDELMGEITFAQAVYLALLGELPSPKVGKLIDAMLVSSIDHGVTPPSALAARTAASTGAPINAAVAVGILSINRHHGGAIEDCMHLLLDAVGRLQGGNYDGVAAQVVAELRVAKKRAPGYGHRVHANDPRTPRLLALAQDAGVTADGIKMALAIQEALAADLGRPLPLNVDGAIAAVLLDLNVPTELANAFFFMARVPGLTAQVYEEITRMRPMRHIHPTDHEYDGPEPRTLA